MTVKKLNVWDILKETNANLTISDWLSVDKSATKDLLDGIKILRARKNKKTEIADGLINIAPIDDRNMMINRLDTGNSSLQFGSESTTTDASMSDNSESYSTSSSDITPFDDIENHEEMNPAHKSKSYVSYPYSIKHIMNSSPLKTMVSINDIMVEAIIDCGAATSVISASLCNRLNLKLTGDVVKISPFDSLEKKACNITMDVPITIGGFTRKEHCCVRNPDVVITKTFNMDPRLYKKEMSRDGRTVKVYPKEQEEYLILGNTFLNAYEMKIDMSNNILSFPIFGGVTDTEVQCYSAEVDTTLDVFSMDTDKTMNQVLYADELLEETKDPILKDGQLDLQDVPDFLKPLLKQYSHCFAEITGFGRVKGVSHKINLIPGAKPLRAQPYKMSWSESEDLDKEISRLLENDVIEPCLGKYTSPCFFIPKADGTNRLVIDYRRLNIAFAK